MRMMHGESGLEEERQDPEDWGETLNSQEYYPVGCTSQNQGRRSTSSDIIAREW